MVVAHKDFLKGLELLVSIVFLQRARFDYLFFPVGGGLVYVLKISLLRMSCQ